MQGSVRALKPAPNSHNYDSTRNKNSDTQKYTHINKTFCSVPFTEACVLKYRCLSKRRILMQDAQEMEQWQRGGELEDCYGNWTNARRDTGCDKCSLRLACGIFRRFATEVNTEHAALGGDYYSTQHSLICRQYIELSMSINGATALRGGSQLPSIVGLLLAHQFGLRYTPCAHSTSWSWKKTFFNHQHWNLHHFPCPRHLSTSDLGGGGWMYNV